MKTLFLLLVTSLALSLFAQTIENAIRSALRNSESDISVQDLENLNTLYLGGTHITDVGLEHLNDLTQAGSLFSN